MRCTRPVGQTRFVVTEQRRIRTALGVLVAVALTTAACGGGDTETGTVAQPSSAQPSSGVTPTVVAAAPTAVTETAGSLEEPEAAPTSRDDDLAEVLSEELATLPFTEGLCRVFSDDELARSREELRAEGVMVESEGMVVFASSVLEVSLEEADEYSALGPEAAVSWLQDRADRMSGQPIDPERIAVYGEGDGARSNLAAALDRVDVDARVFLGLYTGRQWWWALASHDTLVFGGECDTTNWPTVWRSELLPYLRSSPEADLGARFAQVLVDPDASYADYETRKSQRQPS